MGRGSVDGALCVFRLLWSLGRGGFPAALESVAFAVHFQDVDVVGETVQQGSGQSFRAEDFRPLVEGQIGGHVIALAEDLEEQFRAGPGYCKARPSSLPPQAAKGKVKRTTDRAITAGTQCLPIFLTVISSHVYLTVSNSFG